ncbi:WD repeat-containing protein 88-like isoform X2 [Corticium candelabrum]|uniref:WD repeat-containing protein 88-like isoform X2 n=1 Tax=Corticium candelabrum TaxID=121492 RepID=UPI002E253117|nr:WD repeat-containing protein 88-like isoform X2 [Corticium candelabrum]
MMLAPPDRTAKQNEVKVKEIKTHSQIINCCQFCCQDEKFLTGSDNTTLSIWDCYTGRQLQSFHGHTHIVSGCSYHDSLNRIASVSWDTTLRFWDPETATELWSVSHDGLMTTCHVSLDGRLALAAGDDNIITMWDVSSRKRLYQLKGHKSTVMSCQFSPTINSFSSSSIDKTSRLWDMRLMKTLLTLRGHTNAVTSGCFSSDGRLLSTASWDKQVLLWDIATGSYRSAGPVALQNHEGNVSSCEISHNGTTLISSSYDHSVIVWNVDVHCPKLKLQGHTDWVLDCGISKDGNWVLSSSKDKTVRLWNIEGCENLQFAVDNMSQNLGLQTTVCETCGKQFAISHPNGPTKCVFCRLSLPSRSFTKIE